MDQTIYVNGDTVKTDSLIQRWSEDSKPCDDDEV